MKILECENLSIGFKGPLFKNINAHLKAGSLTALMGINGVGKSCLLKTLSTLIDPKTGVIKLNEKSITEYSPTEKAQKIAVVLTEKIHVDFLRVDELVSLGRSPFTNWRGEFQKADKEIISDSMKSLAIENLSASFFSELSDGQKQKVLIARALAQQPTLLILDEPTTYLDIPSKRELIKLLKKISIENNIAILMSTHDLDLINLNADQVWLMGNDGSFTSGTPAELRSAGLFEKHF